MKTIVITAANGFIGEKLVDYLSAENNIVALVRRPLKNRKNVRYVAWDGKNQGSWSKELEGVHAVINLAGRSVNCRYNAKNKAVIYSSRLESTAAIGTAIANCTAKPKVWLNAASATIYAHSESRPNTEYDGIIGEGFSVDVCRKWEACFASFSQPGTRQVILRTAIVLGKNGGVMQPFRNLVRFGFGGRMGKGNQQFSWIHEADVCRAVAFLIDHANSQGVYNLAAPHPVTNSVFMETLRKKMGIRFAIRQPEWLLKFGAWLIGTETELILKSRFVLPARLLEEGFVFRFEKLEDCLEDLLSDNKPEGGRGAKSSMASRLAWHFSFALSLIAAAWFTFFGWMWNWMIAPEVGYPALALALPLLFLGKRLDPRKNRYRIISVTLIVGLAASLLFLLWQIVECGR